MLDKLLRSSTNSSTSGTGGSLSRSSLIRNVATIFQFVVHPSAPLDASNPRTKPTKHTSGGALRPAIWYVDLRRTGTIGKGHPPKNVLGIKRKADVTIECTDRDLLHLAQGQQHPQKLFNMGRIKVKGDLDRALRIASFLNAERSRLFGVPPAQPEGATSNEGQNGSWEREGDVNGDYGSGAPAPIPDRAKL